MIKKWTYQEQSTTCMYIFCFSDYLLLILFDLIILQIYRLIGWSKT